MAGSEVVGNAQTANILDFFLVLSNFLLLAASLRGATKLSEVTPSPCTSYTLRNCKTQGGQLLKRASSSWKRPFESRFIIMLSIGRLVVLLLALSNQSELKEQK
jgi:hypothetical protein